MKEGRSDFKILTHIRIPTGKRPIGRSMRKREDNIRMDRNGCQYEELD